MVICSMGRYDGVNALFFFKKHQKSTKEFCNTKYVINNIFRIQALACGTGTGSSNCTTWSTFLATSTITGDCLILYLASVDNLSINNIYSTAFGTSSQYTWTNVYNSLSVGCNIYSGSVKTPSPCGWG